MKPITQIKRSLIAATVALGCSMTAAAAEPVRLAYSIWVGYGPLFVAQEKGFFGEEGLDIELILIEDTKLRFTALASDQIDYLATSVDAMPLYLKENRDYRYVFGLDESIGADGIVGTTDINSAADLAGKTVAYGEGSVMEFYLSIYLQEAGLTLDDVESVNMGAGDAGSAFVTKQVDAAATWEPYLSRGADTEHGKRLTTSADYPGLIADVLIARADDTETNADELRALYRAWVKTVEFIEANPDEANAIMGQGLGGWLEDPAVIADVLTGVKFMSGDRNAEYLGTPEAPGVLAGFAQNAIDLWASQDKIQVDDATGASLISHIVLE